MVCYKVSKILKQLEGKPSVTSWGRVGQCATCVSKKLVIFKSTEICRQVF